MTPAGLLLPAPRRTFATGWHDRLIKAAIHADDATAFAHADAWLRANDIDTALPRDHRLLVEVAARFGPRLAEHSAYPRLVGLRRMLWTRSQMALREIMPALSATADAGARLLLVKDTARLAETGDAGEARIARNIDILVHPDEIGAAFDSLIARGWMPGQSLSPLYLREHLASMRSVGFFKDNLGDILLYNRPFPPGHGTGDDAGFRDRARPAFLDGLAVWLPSPEDGLALAVADGGLAGHARSDWLVDAAAILSRHRLDWQGFQTIVTARRLQAPALFALSYLRAEAGLPIPATVIAGLSKAAVARPLAYLLACAEARLRDGAGVTVKAMRGVGRLLRKRAARREMPRAPDRRLSARSIGASDGEPSFPALEQHLAVPPNVGAGRLHVHAVLRLASPPVRRRIEFELNSAERHICRIRYRKWTGSARPITLAIDGAIDILPGETELTLVARPGRLLRGDHGPGRKARYDALPFSGISFEFSRERSGTAFNPPRIPRGET